MAANGWFTEQDVIVKKRTYSLEMDEAEIQCLYDILIRIGGSSDTTRRALAASILKAVEEIWTVNLPDDFRSLTDIEGSINFLALVPQRD